MLPRVAVSGSDIARAAVAAAFTAVEPGHGDRVDRDHRWQYTFARHLTDLDIAIADNPACYEQVAAAGLAEAHEMFSLSTGRSESAGNLRTTTVCGSASPIMGLQVPHRGRFVGGEELIELVGQWVERGIVVTSVGTAIEQVVRNPEWLRLRDQTVVVLGANAKVGPFVPLLRWGARVVGIDLPDDEITSRLRGHALGSAGSAVLPVAGAGGAAGVDLRHGIEPVARWLESFDERLVIADCLRGQEGEQFTLSLAADALIERLLRSKPDTSLSYLATPADSYLVHTLDMSVSRDAYAAASTSLKRAARAASRGLALQPNYPHLTLNPVVDAHMPQHSWDFAMAKRVQRWRAVDAVANGALVSNNVAPATVSTTMRSPKVTRLVAGSVGRSGIWPFEVATARTLMAALLVHDLRTADVQPESALEREYAGAVHGGMWTSPYKPASVVGLAVKGRHIAEQFRR